MNSTSMPSTHTKKNNIVIINSLPIQYEGQTYYGTILKIMTTNREYIYRVISANHRGVVGFGFTYNAAISDFQQKIINSILREHYSGKTVEFLSSTIISNNVKNIYINNQINSILSNYVNILSSEELCFTLSQHQINKKNNILICAQNSEHSINDEADSLPIVFSTNYTYTNIG